MRGIIIHKKVLDQKSRKRLKRNKKDNLLIVSEYCLYHALQQEKYRVVYINVQDTEYYVDKEKITKDIVDSIYLQNPQIKENSHPMAIINTIFECEVGIVVNVVKQIEKIVEKYKLDELVLRGGNRKVFFSGINLGEAEQAFHMMYRREWFVNPYIWRYFSKRLKIAWKEDKSIPIQFTRGLRRELIMFGKVGIKIHKAVRGFGWKQKKKLKLEKWNCWIMIRTPVQIDTLLPIYRKMLESKKISPVIMAYENYTMHGLREKLEDMQERYVDMYRYLYVRDIVEGFFASKAFVKTIKGAYTDAVLSVYHCGNLRLLMKECEHYYFDIWLLERILDRIKRAGKSKVKMILNNETSAWPAATQALWAKRNAVFSAAVEQGRLELRPRTSWNDIYFMSSKSLTDSLQDAKPEERYVLAGPCGYDFLYNTADKSEGLNNVIFMTAPDAYTEQSLIVIEDIINIVSKEKLKVNLTIKLHPREKGMKRFKKYEKFQWIKVLRDECQSIDIIPHCDLVISFISSTLLQSIIIGVPIVSIHYDKITRDGIAYLDQKICSNVANKKELKDVFLHYGNIRKRYLKNRVTFIKEQFGDYNGDGSSKIVNDIEERVFFQ